MGIFIFGVLIGSLCITAFIMLTFKVIAMLVGFLVWTVATVYEVPILVYYVLFTIGSALVAIGIWW